MAVPATELEIRHLGNETGNGTNVLIRIIPGNNHGRHDLLIADPLAVREAAARGVPFDWTRVNQEFADLTLQQIGDFLINELNKNSDSTQGQ
jgi:hypothetical protein